MNMSGGRMNGDCCWRRIEVNKRTCHENMKGKIFDYKLMKKESAAHNFPGNKGYIHT